MGLLLYTNGISESYKPKQLVFTEEELITLFSEFDVIKTFRVLDVLNTWAIYGEPKIQDQTEFNRIGSESIGEQVFSHILFVHDSELNPDWKVTDQVLYNGYDEFEYQIQRLIAETADSIMNHLKNIDEDTSYLPQLETLGTTEDKRILFGFKPEDQNPEFYENEEFIRFSQNIYDFISTHKQLKEPFTIYADKKAIIIVEKDDVPKLLNTISKKFETNEEYEVCENINNILQQWNKKITKPTKKKRGPKPKTSNDMNKDT